MKPTEFWKSMLQQGRFAWSRAFDPFQLYRGLPVAVLSIAPITCIQFSCNNVCTNGLLSLRGRSGRPSDLDLVLSGCVAGMASALVQSPFQLVDVNQQNFGGSMLTTARRVYSTCGVSGFFRGLSMTAAREGVFCVSCLAAAPRLKEVVRGVRPGISDQAASAVSSVVAGVISAVLSHPADTIKTCLQGSLLPPPATTSSSGASPFQAARGPRDALAVMRQSGPLARQLYRGFSPRAFRLICCVYIYSGMTEVLEAVARGTDRGILSPSKAPRV